MAELTQSNDFRTDAPPVVPSPGAGGNKLPPPKESGLERYNRERREKKQAEKDAAAQREKDAELLREAVKRFDRAAKAEAENRAKALEDLKFKAGDQWPADIKAQRNMDKRPIITVNTIPTLVHQVENEIRQNRPGINVSPVGSRATKEAAEIYAGIIRAIERESSAEIAYDTAVISAIDIGFGYIRVLTDYVNDHTFDQTILIKRVRNSFTILLDPDRQELDGADAKYGFVSDMMPRAEFKDKYPSAIESAWNPRAIGDDLKHWITKDAIRVAEYYAFENKTRTLVKLSTGHEGFKDELSATLKASIAAGTVKILESRESEVQKLMWYKITSDEVLERTEWLGKWIPIVEVIGDEIDIEGSVQRVGVIRNAKDPARMRNYWATAKAEYSALRSKVDFIGPEGSFDGYESKWRGSNQKSYSYLEFVSVTAENGQVLPPPQRQPAPQVPQGYVEAEQTAQQDMMRTTGIRFDASVQDRMYDESGKALKELRRTSDIGSYHYADNFGYSLRHLGRILIDLIPKVMNTKRMVPMLAEDGKDSMVQLDPQAPKPVGSITPDPNKGPVKVFNPTIDEFVATVTIGPSYATRRIEAQEQITKLIQAVPAAAQVLAPLVAKYSDWPGASEAFKMLMAALPPNVQQAEMGNLPPQAQAFMMSLQRQIAQLMGERQQMLRDLTDQKALTAIKAEDVRNKRIKIDRDFEVKLLSILAGIQKAAREFHAQDLDRALDTIRDLLERSQPEKKGGQ